MLRISMAAGTAEHHANTHQNKSQSHSSKTKYASPTAPLKWVPIAIIFIKEKHDT